MQPITDIKYSRPKYLAWRGGDRWSESVTEWLQSNGRRVGHPDARWADDISAIVGRNIEEAGTETWGTKRACAK